LGVADDSSIAPRNQKHAALQVLSLWGLRFFGLGNRRTILGSMNDFDRMLDPAPGQSLTSAALELAEAPCGPIAMESPNRATVHLFASPHLDSALIQFPWKPVGR